MDEGVTGRRLMDMTEDSLKDKKYDLHSLGHRKEIMRQVRSLRRRCRDELRQAVNC